MKVYWIATAVPLLVQLFLFVRWLHRRLRDDEIQRAFVRDLAINHLPHIYHGLRQLAAHLGIELTDSPPIQWVEVNHEAKPR